MKQVRSMVIGIVIGAFAATAGTAFGAPALEKISAILRPDYVVKVDGKSVNMKNKPLAYDGNTYIPLREAGEIFGYDVGFKAGTITLDQNEKEVIELPNESTETENPTEPSATNINLNDWVSYKLLDEYKVDFKTAISTNPGQTNVTLTYDGVSELFPVSNVVVGDKIFTNDKGNHILIKVQGGFYFEKQFIQSFTAQ
ncbi:stalk domain-containing protein [Cohnella lupini]|uniref:Copper amine oxidase-like protein n=1 Tax=Cohnella lupini TaxID=1294267 RepID=A0A3D9HZ84_9BACL|nr:stalk domain-containing protein [Cohnella lupini]RED54804.1 copper amine oxidase-like protein [Cohnella lupini]